MLANGYMRTIKMMTKTMMVRVKYAGTPLPKCPPPLPTPHPPCPPTAPLFCAALTLIISYPTIYIINMIMMVIMIIIILIIPTKISIPSYDQHQAAILKPTSNPVRSDTLKAERDF